METAGLKTILDSVKIILIPHVEAVILLACAFFLYAPEHILDMVGCVEFANDNQHIAGPAMVVVSIDLLLRVFHVARAKIRHHLEHIAGIKRQKKILELCGRDENEILLLFIAERTMTLLLDPDDEIVYALQHAGILIPVPNLYGRRYPDQTVRQGFRLSEFARKKARAIYVRMHKS